MRKKIENLPAYITIAVLLSAITIIMTTSETPEFFDHFGVIIFACLFIAGGWMFFTKKAPPRWISFFIWIVSLLGLIADGRVVFNG